MVQARRRMELNNLIILDGQVVSRSFQMRDLHEESLHERLTNVDVVVLRRELRAGALEVEAIHNASELLTNIVG